jgi:hypothetical protein
MGTNYYAKLVSSDLASHLATVKEKHGTAI